jgi:hypothetical protein
MSDQSITNSRWRCRSGGALFLLALLAGCRSGAELAVVTETTKLRRDERLPATSAIFDGARVRLRGARGETLALQVLTRAHVAPSQLTIAASPTTDVRIDAFVLHWLDVAEPSTAMYGPSRGKGAYPDPLEPSANGAAKGDALYDVVIARDAAPGAHSGTLTVGARQFPVELVVEPLAIAVEDEPFVWIWYRPADIAHAHHVDDRDDAVLPLERRYHALARAHGAYFADDLPRDRFDARREFMRGTRYWPVDLPYDAGDDALKKSALAWADVFATLPQTAFSIVLDEPHTHEDRLEARRRGDLIGAHEKLLRVTTAPPDPDFDGAIDVDCAPAGRGLHRWTYNGAPPSAGSMIVDTDGAALRTWGWIAMRYGVELWHAWDGTYYEDRYNRGGATDVLRNPLTFDQRRNDKIRSPDWGNGDGVLVYPVGDAVWPSLRLKAMRRGLEDRLILRALEACGAHDVVARETRALVPRALDEGRGTAAWPVDEAAWEAARGRLYDAWKITCAKTK